MTAQKPPATVAQDIALHCDDELGRPITFMASFCYFPEDPFAVWLTFHIPPGDIPWVMARSLLHRGLTGPAGDGDIRLWPDVDGAARSCTWTSTPPRGG